MDGMSGFDWLDTRPKGLVVVEVATRRIHGVRRRATQPVTSRRARGADLELDLTAPAVLERAGPARHGSPPAMRGCDCEL